VAGEGRKRGLKVRIRVGKAGKERIWVMGRERKWLKGM